MSSKAEKAAEDAVLEVVRKHPGGATQDVMQTALPSMQLTDIVMTVNRLMARSAVKMFQQGNTLLWQEAKVEDAAKLKGLSAEDLLVYQVIKAAGNSGIWTKDIKMRTNLAQPQVTKIIKVLEQRALIKSVKNVNNPSRKLYMLSELEPSREITGGAWYTENQFDSEFIEVLREACFAYINRQGDTTLKEVALFIRNKGFSKVDLRMEDIQCIVNTLIYDGRVDEVDDENDDDSHYRPAVLPVPNSTAFTATPCGVCPVFKDCHEDGIVSPQSCLYYSEWLKF